MKKTQLISVLLLIMALFISGCTAEEPDGVAQYIADVAEQSDLIKISLEQDVLTQTEMNEKSGELYKLWDDALNYLWDELEGSLSEADFEGLLDDQTAWTAEKDDAAEEAGKGYEGGSMYPLVVNCEAARITEERVVWLYEILETGCVPSVNE